MKYPGVFCLEGEWDPDLRYPTTVRTLLDTMQRCAGVPTIYRDIGTVQELEFYMRRWRQKRYSDYSVGWLAFHGSPGYIHIGRKALSLTQLADAIGLRTCVGKTIYLGSCATMQDGAAVRELKTRTGARAVCGYTNDVDWMEAAAFELLLLSTLTRYEQTAAALRRVQSEYGALADRIGFVSEPSWRAKPRPG